MQKCSRSFLQIYINFSFRIEYNIHSIFTNIRIKFLYNCQSGFKMVPQNLLTCDTTNFVFKYNHMNSSYQASLKIVSMTDKYMHFKIVSTFGRLLIQTSKFKKVQGKKQIQLNFKLKIPNQIKKGQEKIIITYSKNDISSNVWIRTDKKLQLQMIFEGDFQQDEMINQILKSDAKQICEEANSHFHKNQIKNAKNKYEEAFFLFRQYVQSLYGMSQCEYIQQDLESALTDIETALLMEQNQKFYLLKLKIIYEIYKHRPQCYYLLKYLKERLNNIKHQQYNKQMDFMYYDICKKLENLQLQKGEKDILDFMENILQRFQHDQSLRNIYHDKDLLQKQLQDILEIKRTNTLEETPQEVLDPITYEIMKQPLIVPAGHSYDSSSLRQYMKKHGAKDPISHTALHQQWIKPNHTLKNYIKNNPKLIEWIKYQQEVTTFK